jgi:antirestriction protein ArdC
MPSQTEIRRQVTQQIVAALEQNLLPWRRPWRAAMPSASQPGRHSNVASRKAYQGVNPLLLELHAMQHGLTSRWWGTFPMWKSLGCSIKKRPPNVEEGHWGCRVVFWKPLTTAVATDDPTNEEEERRFVLRTFTVFSADQVEGAEAFRVHADGQPAVEPDFAPAEDLMVATGAEIRYGGDRAYYSRGGDFIVLPPKTAFDPPGAFWETACHELAHWSEPRTGWDDKKNGYALGELVAEIASCYVCQELGVPQGESLGNHVAYLKSWLEALRNDRSCIFKATKQASKVTDFLLGFVKKPQPEAAGASA